MKDFFKNKKFNKNKLLHFGFFEKNNMFIYHQTLLDNQFTLTIQIDRTGNIQTRLTESETGELYTLHLVEGSTGNFVGKIKDEYKQILEKISEECFESDVFKSAQTKELIEYVNAKYNSDPEFLWEKFTDNAIVRRKDNAKWYAAFLTVSKQKLGFDDNTIAEIIDLRAEDVDKIVDNKTVFPGYHMNKKHWITIILDGSVPIDFIKTKIDTSYELALKNKKY